jgi:L-ascorbate metabolism protein UlaG (beta-lactamase superfamily)
MKLIKRGMIAFLVVLLMALAVMVGVGFFISAPGYRGPVSDHFDGKAFINPGHASPGSFGAMLKWMVSREPGTWLKSDSLKTTIPSTPPDSSWHVTFVNHSTFLIQTGSLNILTDPVWSERTSPFSWAGPQRMKPVGIAFDDLPPIDLIVLSHNHYDHLDIETLQKLVERFHPKIVVPLGVDLYLKQKGISSHAVLDWWEKTSVGNFTVEAVPAQHFSARGMFDRNQTLWCGYVIRDNQINTAIYFAGDTGYNPVTFKEIGMRCSPIQLALIPIGAYKPAWFMSPIHCSPEEAIQIHLDVKAHQSLAMHFGTFPLADDGEREPEASLDHALRAKSLFGFKALPNGGVYQLEIK